jgi:restriction system protein
MAIPKFDELFTAVLKGLPSGVEIHNREFRTQIADGLGLSTDERNQKISNGSSRIENRLYWAILYLVQAGALTRPKRGYLAITDQGLKLLDECPDGVTLGDLEKTEGIQNWYQRTIELKESRSKSVGTPNSASTQESGIDYGSPIERMQDASDALRAEIANQLLEKLRSMHWEFMEHAVLKVLFAMGYGSSQDELFHVGGPYDGGIDGIIWEDKLGLSRIYVQSKRYQEGSSISGAMVRQFIGRMDETGITKGVFITASHFTPEALKAVETNTSKQVALIDGAALAGIMVDHGVGVTVEAEFQAFKVDENFFDD